MVLAPFARLNTRHQSKLWLSCSSSLLVPFLTLKTYWACIYINDFIGNIDEHKWMFSKYMCNSTQLLWSQILWDQFVKQFVKPNATTCYIHYFTVLETRSPELINFMIKGAMNPIKALGEKIYFLSFSSFLSCILVFLDLWPLPSSSKPNSIATCLNGHIAFCLSVILTLSLSLSTLLHWVTLDNLG